VSDEEPRSGSRWEPAAADHPRANADYATELHTIPPMVDILDRQVAVAAAEHPAWAPPYLPPTTSSAAIPRSAKRRRAITAAVGVVLLLIGGGAAYAIGHVTAPTSGTPGTFGHGHGRPGGFRNGDGAGFGGTAAGGAGTAGSGSTGAGSST
jgi:hypothetical protein